MGEKKLCIADVYSPGAWRSHPCDNPAKYGDFCGIHCPDKKKERAAQSPMPQWERDFAHRKEEEKRVKALESSHAELLGEVDRLKKLAHRNHYYCEDGWYSCPKAEDGCYDEHEGDDCNCGADEHNAEVEARQAIARAEEVK